MLELTSAPIPMLPTPSTFCSIKNFHYLKPVMIQNLANLSPCCRSLIEISYFMNIEQYIQTTTIHPDRQARQRCRPLGMLLTTQFICTTLIIVPTHYRMGWLVGFLFQIQLSFNVLVVVPVSVVCFQCSYYHRHQH